MKYGICLVSVAPVRLSADDRSEMVTQLLFGEKIEILETHPKWWNIKLKYDAYEGWIDPKMILEISSAFYHEEDNKLYTADLFNLIQENHQPIVLTLGAHLVNFSSGKLQVADKIYQYDGDYVDATNNSLSLTQIALMYLNTPYLWGGKSNFGIDCSGFVQQVFKLKNIFLPRDARQQAQYGEVLSFIDEAVAGDLAFFDNEEGNIIHVGIILGEQKIIHAHGKVRIDPIDSTGIFNTDSQQYSHKLRLIKSFDSD
ncbi:MAG: C40 family peptidase [Flavobacteriaceae bacterium]|nr:C40 family peptidase [Flavobacteriaceae bacterium]